MIGGNWVCPSSTIFVSVFEFSIVVEEVESTIASSFVSTTTESIIGFFISFVSIVIFCVSFFNMLGINADVVAIAPTAKTELAIIILLLVFIILHFLLLLW